MKRSVICVLALLFTTSSTYPILASAADSGVSSVPNYRGEDDPYSEHKNPDLPSCSGKPVSFRIENRTDMYILFDVIRRNDSKIVFRDWKLKPNGGSIGWCMSGTSKNYIIEFDAYPDTKARQLKSYNVVRGGGTYNFREKKGAVVLTKK